MKGCQIMKKYQINPRKNIGSAILIVEGADFEFKIAETIFVNNLGFELITKTRNDTLFKYQNRNNPNSRVAVLNCKKNQLHVIDFDEINKLFVDLITNYDFVLANSARFYIYDRDVYSYTGSQRNAPREYIQLLTNARDDGLLLLSYPCIEAFVTSNFDDNAHQRSHEKGSDDLKPFNKSNQYYQQNIDLSSLAKSVLQMDKALELLGINDYDFSDFACTNL